MRKPILIILFIFISFGLQSQVLIALLLGDKLNTGKIEFGLDGGFNYSSITGMDSNNYDNSFFLGFYFDIKMKENWYLNTGFLVKSTMGIDELTDADLEFLQATTYDTEGKYKQQLSYWVLPVLAKYKFKNHMYAEAGLQFALLRKSWIEFNSKIEGNSAKIKETNTDMLNRFDTGIVAGTGFRLLKGLGWTIGVRYYYGFIDVYKEGSGNKNNSLFLKMNVPMGLSEKAKAEIKEYKASKKETKAKKKEEKKRKKEEEKENTQ